MQHSLPRYIKEGSSRVRHTQFIREGLGWPQTLLEYVLHTLINCMNQCKKERKLQHVQTLISYAFLTIEGLLNEAKSSIFEGFNSNKNALY